MQTSQLILDVSTILRMIQDEDLDLQPDFQRANVWNLQAKQRLIDSVLRGWHVPPVHIVQREGFRDDVLDGQQRLTALWEFARDTFPVDGRLAPYDAELASLHGLTYSRMPMGYQLAFRRFSLHVIRLADLSPGEAGEFFYRLNSSVVSLTPAEQRNALYGPAREQVRQVVDHFEHLGGNERTIGFSNSRMAYDDTFARFLVCLERGTVREKVTPEMLELRYRADQGFSEAVVGHCQAVAGMLALAVTSDHERITLNKATLFTWLWFIGQVGVTTPADVVLHGLASLIRDVESLRKDRSAAPALQAFRGTFEADPSLVRRVLGIYNDRATSRVTDAMSVVVRNVIVWMLAVVHSDGYVRYSDDALVFERAMLARTLWGTVNYGELTEHQLFTYGSAAPWDSSR